MASGTIPQTWTNGGTGYCKLPDGTQMCWGTATLDTPRNAQGINTGQMYYHEYPINLTFPVSFKATPRLIVSKTTGRMCTIGWASCNYQMITEIDTLDTTETVSTAATVSYLAIGKWK